MTTSFEAHERTGAVAWFHDAVIYEVHVRAFADANGDGIGDFKGLTSKLDYLRDLGITALWVLPFYPSPLRDDGYDIADYKSINPAYGTMADFRQFLREAHKRDLKVITELVINHTSDQHPWFQLARRAPAGSPERDFYVWSDDPERYKDARIIFQDTETSNWSWDPVANAYYWHRFFSHQPDLNFENPSVHEAVFDALEFWLDAGVDGVRLDAIPYLYEREGTMCENLPETHDFLRELRARVDARYDDRMLLAEANQWPEDSVAYFGRGDECHMCFHFPLMPRLFMSLRMENRFPIIDILEQTPPIPENAAWAIFLRNHDELTLEMVTDEERDYMYRVYANDPQTRINVGIRRRLTPLLGNNRREIELMKALLLSLPGTPVLYYGDEIGMGDNVYLGDRNGVRTPMQWSGDRNAGFSDAIPQQLYFPVITDPEYHYETINVEVQRDNPNSLWWWVKRSLSLRKGMPELSRGSLEFVPNENPKVLAYLRTLGDRSVLVVANLSRHTQPVELELSGFEGVEPVELFGRTRFPAIGVNPYLLTLGPHDFYWFGLDRSEAEAEEPYGLPRIMVRGELSGVFRLREQLDRALLADIGSRRWFRSKAQTIRGGHMVDRIDVPGTDSMIVFLQVEYVEQDQEIYAIPIALATGLDAERRLLETPAAAIAEVHAGTETGLLYDATSDPSFATALVHLAAGRKKLRGRGVTVSASPTAHSRHLTRDIMDQPVRVVGAEQTNTSVIFGEQVILKLFRRFDPGPNPEVEVGRFLTERAGFEHVAATRGVLDVDLDSKRAAFAVVHQFVPNLGDAWSHTLASLGLIFEQVAARRAELGRPPEPMHPLDITDAELDDVAALIGIPLHEASLLGQRTGEMHLALASRADDPVFAPQRLSTLYQRSLYQSTRSSIRTSCNLLRRRRSHLTPIQLELAEMVLAREHDLLEGLRSITTEKIEAVRLRVHGDFHLGQVLFTGNDFVIIDFEGEPQRPLSERRIKRLGLRDVAGMLRSYQYTTQMALRAAMESGVEEPEQAAVLAEWADAFARWLAAGFLRGYLGVVEGTPIVPSEARHLKRLLDTLLLDKAAYELGYELNNRPDWVDIPLRGILLASTAYG
ncbi:MAG: maltose alpha-D-glucosyltransferase [Acidimicrobiia bacterium]